MRSDIKNAPQAFAACGTPYFFTIHSSLPKIDKPLSKLSAGAPMKICEAKFHGEVRSDVGMKKAPVLRPGLLHGPKSATNWSWWTDSNPRPADYKLHILAFALFGVVQYIAVQSHSSCASVPCCAALLCRIVDQKLTIANKNPGGHTHSRRGILAYFCI